jgi:hypothetical protein
MGSGRASPLWGLAPHFLGGLIVIAAAAYAGLWLGGRGMTVGAPGEADVDASVSESGNAAKKPAAPQRFYAYLGWDRLPIADAVLEEARLAEAVGVDAIIVPVDVPWPGHGTRYAEAFEPVRRVMEAATSRSVVLDLRLAPPDSWYVENPSAHVVDEDNAASEPALTSKAWREDSRLALRAAAEWLNNEGLLPRVSGVALRGHAVRPWGALFYHDNTEATQEAFADWLRHAMRSDDFVRTVVNSAGGPNKVAFEDALADVKPFELGAPSVYAKFASKAVADAIIHVARETKAAFGAAKRVYVPYGFSFAGYTGHDALGDVLAVAYVDGIIAPVSSVNRGVGAVGGFVGPITSALAHGKEWIHVDDTRTGLERDAERDAPASNASDQIYHVQRRNFAAALVHGLSYAPADALGMGSMVDRDMWERFGRMRDVALVQAEMDAERIPKQIAQPVIVVLAQSGAAYLPQQSPIASAMLRNIRDAALRSGAPLKFALLDDVLDGRIEPAKAYLFANAFELSSADQLQLRRLLERNGATAIWMVAPGVVGPKKPEENVSDVVGMRVRRFPTAATSGSVSDIVSPWIEQGTEFGEGHALNPLFYIDDEEASTIALYRSSKKVSAAIKFFGGDGAPEWSSIYVAEPSLPAGLLRELLQIVDVHLFIETTEPPSNQTMHIGRGLIGIHANEMGERLLDFGESCEIVDVLNPARGWPKRRYLTFPMSAGETVIFRLNPEPGLD